MSTWKSKYGIYGIIRTIWEKYGIHRINGFNGLSGHPVEIVNNGIEMLELVTKVANYKKFSRNFPKTFL